MKTPARLLSTGAGILAKVAIVMNAKRRKPEESIVVEGICLLAIPGWEGKYSISECGRVYRHPYRRGADKLGRRPRFPGKWIKSHLSSGGYVQVSLRQKTKGLHQLLALAFLERRDETLEVDHVNGDCRDNRVENLRWCSHAENMRNSKSRRSSKSKFLGVSPYRDGVRFVAQLTRPGYSSRYLGIFESEEAAAHVYDKEARAYYGEFANTNFAES